MTTFASNINVPAFISNIDWLVLSLIVILNIAVIVYSHRHKTTSAVDYMLMGRRLTLPLFVATLVTAWYGKIFVVTQVAFENGIFSFYVQGIFWYIVYLCFALFMVRKIRAHKANTLPEFIRRIYGEKSRALTAVLMFTKTLPIMYILSMIAALKIIFPLTFLTATCIVMTLTTFYVILGGLRTVAYTNMLHLFFMCSAVACVLVFSVMNYGGLDFLQSNLPSSYLQPRGTHSLTTMLAWFLIACSTTFVSPIFYQRCVAAASDRIASIGIILSTVVWILFDICTTFGAMYAKAIIPDANSFSAYITYSMQLLPTGLRAVFIAGIIATILSSIESSLFIAANCFEQDLAIFKNRSKEFRRIGAAIITIIFSIIISLIFGGKFKIVWAIAKSYFMACLIIPMLYSYIWPSLASDKMFYTSAVLTCASITLWQICGAYAVTGIDSFFIGCGVSGLVLAIFTVRSFTLRQGEKKLHF